MHHSRSEKRKSNALVAVGLAVGLPLVIAPLVLLSGNAPSGGTIRVIEIVIAESAVMAAAVGLVLLAARTLRKN